MTDRAAAVEPHWRRYERGSPWAAYGAAIWAWIFAVFHIVWAAGWYPLWNAEQARSAFANPGSISAPCCSV